MSQICRVLFIACILLVGVSISSAQMETENRIVYGLTLDISGIDPHVNRSSELGIVLRSVYDTLVYRGSETGDFVPGLAREWQISEDQLEYTFTLRDDILFHDGTPFNAEAVGANLDRITDPNLASQKARFMLGSYRGYRLIDEYTISIVLSSPYAPLLDSLSQVYLGMASPTAFNQYLDEPLRYQFHQVGTGPYIFDDYLPGERIVLRRNPDYRWSEAVYDQVVEQPLDVIEFRFFTDAATRATALQNGDVQIIGELPAVDARSFVGSGFIQLAPAEVPGQPMQFYLNTQQPPTDSRAVRQAILYATNRNLIVDTVFQGFSPVAWGPLSAATPFYTRAMEGLYAYDIVQAQSLLASEGYVDSDDDGFLDRDGEVLELRVLVPPWGSHPEVAQLMRQQYESIGIRVELVRVPGFVQLLEAVRSGEYNLVAFQTFGMDPSLLNEHYLSTGSSNWSQISDQELDNILIQATGIIDIGERNALYAQAQAIIMNSAVVLPIRDHVNLNAHTSSIINLSFDPYGWFPALANVSYIPDS